MSVWNDAWGYARAEAPSVPRACTTCGISAPAHDEAVAVGVVRVHAWTGSTDPRPKTDRTDEKEARP